MESFSSLDAHLIVQSVQSLKKKYIKAVEQEKETHVVWKELDALLEPQTKEQLSELEKQAMEYCGDHLKIYQVNMPASQSSLEHGLCLAHSLPYPDSHVIGKGKDPAVPLQAKQKYSSWLSSGLRLEQMQYVPISSLSSQLFTCAQKQSSDLCPQISVKTIIAQCNSSSKTEGEIAN